MKEDTQYKKTLKKYRIKITVNEFGLQCVVVSQIFSLEFRI